MKPNTLTVSDLLSNGDHICTFKEDELWLEFHNKDLYHNGDMYHIIGFHTSYSESICTLVASRIVNSPLYLLTFSSFDDKFAEKVDEFLVYRCTVHPETHAKGDFRYTITRTELENFIRFIYFSCCRDRGRLRPFDS